MRLDIRRAGLGKVKSIVMYTVSFLMILGIVGFAAPRFFNQIANAAAPTSTYVAFDGVDIGTNSYTLSSGITATYTGSNTIKLTGYAPIVTPWFGPSWTTYNYVTVGIKLPTDFVGTTVYQTGVIRQDSPYNGVSYKMSTIGDGSTPLATAGAALGYLDFSFAANSTNTKKDGLVKLQVIWTNGATPEYFTIDVSGLSTLPDTTPPVITVDPYTTSWTNQDVVVTASTNEGSLNTTTHTFTVNDSFDFVATDTAGNSTTTTVTISNIDKTAPTVGGMQNNNYLFNTNFNFILTDVDWDVSGKHSAQYRLDSGDWQDLMEALPVGSWYGAYIISEGTHTLEYNLTDNAGNSTTGTVTVKLDKTAPVGGILTWATVNHHDGTSVLPVDNLYTITPPLKGEDAFTSLSLVANDNNIDMAPVPVYIDGSGIANGNMVFDNDDGLWYYVPGTPLIFAQGTHFLRAIFADLAGNTTTLTARFRTDRTAPSGGDLTWFTDFHGLHTETPDSNGLYEISQPFSLNDSNPSFSLIVNDNNLILDDEVDVYIDGDINGYLYYDYNDEVWYYNDGDWSLLIDGTYELSSTFVDRTGYETTLTVEIAIDSTAPVITIGTYESGPTNKDIVVDATTDEGTLNDDSHTFTANGCFTFMAIDAAGNSSEEKVCITNIDKVAPVITLNGSGAMQVAVGETFTDPGATANDDSKVTVAGLVNTAAPGEYTLTYNSIDAAGNNATPVTRTVTVIPLVLATTTGQVLGDTTDTTNTDTGTTTDKTGEIKGTSDNKKEDAPWYDATFMGLAWYWWVVLAIAAGGLGWWAFGAIRNRNQN